MNESFPGQPDEKESERAEYFELARQLSEKQEKFPFPGINPESYARLKKTTNNSLDM